MALSLSSDRETYRLALLSFMAKALHDEATTTLSNQTTPLSQRIRSGSMFNLDRPTANWNVDTPSQESLLRVVAAIEEGRANEEAMRRAVRDRSVELLLRQMVGNPNAFAAPGASSTPQSLSSLLLLSKPTFPAGIPQKNHHHVTQPGSSRILEQLGSNLRDQSDSYVDCALIKLPRSLEEQHYRKKSTVEAFPEKLYRILQDMEEQGLSDIASFFAHGRAFGVHDVGRFVAEIMPKYFKQTKYTSFTRQLHLWGFLRIGSGPDSGGFYHDLFLHGRPHLNAYMKRVGVPKGVDRRRLKNKVVNRKFVPVFYAMNHPSK
jgi:hypothetical protein